METGFAASGRRGRLLGRVRECADLDGLLEAIRASRSRSLVLCGEAGIGKTALLEYLIEAAPGLTVLKAVGVESEMELPYAGLHQLCVSLLDRLSRLPDPQQQALETVFGVIPGTAPDRFLVALAVLSLLSDVAGERAVLCVVDDAQWLDQASALTLAFVARRLQADPVGIVFSAREPGQELSDLPRLEVNGLVSGDARELLDTAVADRLDVQVRDRIVAETRGNPLALLELPHGLTATQLAGLGPLDAEKLSGSIEESFAQRVALLPEDTQLLLLAAAAEPTGDPLLLWRAAPSLDTVPAALQPAVEASLIDVGTQVRFRHPLVRSALYVAASDAERRRVHAALADATDVALDPDRRAWHRAQATDDTDEDVAAELEHCADHAQSRGGIAAAAAFLERASSLTQDPDHRADLALQAAELRWRSGDPDAARRLLAQVEAEPLDELRRARVHMVRGQLAFGSSNGRDAPSLLLGAAQELELIAPDLARDTYLDALASAMFVGRLAGEIGLVEVAHAARGAPPSSSPRPRDLLLDGLAMMIVEGYDRGAPVLKRAVAAFRAEILGPADMIRSLWLASHAALSLWDDESWEKLSSKHIQLARQSAALSVLPHVLQARVGFHLFAGELATAASLVDELSTLIQATGSGILRYDVLALAAFRGRESEIERLTGELIAELQRRGEGVVFTLVEHASAVLYNGLGRYEDACDAAQRAAAYPQELAFSTRSLPQLIEAAVRTDRIALAERALDRLAQTTRASGSEWGLGVEARSRALLSAAEEAEPHYREAIERLSSTSVRSELARAHLLYGEWLRRGGRRVDARNELRTAHVMFTDMGMEAFIERARRELVASGETARKRVVETRDDLTAQERQVAELARDGLSNPEIGARLFLSARTVEWHLHKVFGKLEIRSRHQLAEALASQEAEPTHA